MFSLYRVVFDNLRVSVIIAQGDVMLKKILLLLLVIALSIASVFASDWHFVFGDLTQHPEIVWGFLPSYIDAGVGYSGLSFLEGHKTDFQFLVGGGYNQRKLWQNPITGDWIENNPLIYDVIDFDWSFRLAQGFFSSPMDEKDLITLTVAYNGQYEIANDSMAKGKERENGDKAPVLSIDEFFSAYPNFNSNIYPEINGNRQFLGTQLAAYLKLDIMEDTIHENDGFLAELAFMWGPKALNKALDGFADYYAIAVDAVGAYTLYNYAPNGKSWFSVVLADRVNFSYTGGDSIPAFIQEPNSLGRKVRGFSKSSYNTEYSIVNNLDIRLSGPDLGVKGIAPRVNLFFDMGYGWGNINNTTIDKSIFLASTGIQGTITIFDFIDFGYQIAYLIKGDNFEKGSGENVAGKFTFFLDF